MGARRARGAADVRRLTLVDRETLLEEATDYVDANAESDGLVLVSRAYARTVLFYCSDRGDLRIAPVVDDAGETGLRPIVEDE